MVSFNVAQFGVLTNSLSCNKIALSIPLGSSQIDGVANVYDVFAVAIKEREAFQQPQRTLVRNVLE
ncbi:hypothetical protein AGMMS50230_07960 [Spirochaetia bacterium]|nr:hypothetical protein AGMMS50230_07960 [Spirochaetia bacterium]